MWVSLFSEVTSNRKLPSSCSHTSEKQMIPVTVTHHLKTNTQPVPKQWSAPTGQLPPVYKVSRIVCGTASSSQLSWLYSFPDLVHLLAGTAWDTTSPWLWESTAQHELKHQCVINTILILNPKHSTVPANKMKINSIPAGTRTKIKVKSETLRPCLPAGG